MRKRLIYLLIAAFFLGKPLSFAASFNYESSRIERVEIILPKRYQGTYQPHAIAAELKTKTDHTFSQEQFDADLKHLSSQFATVEPEIRESGDKLIVTIHLQPKPEISSIVFEGNRSLSDKKLKKELQIHSGETFDRAKFIQGFIRLKEFYLKKSYFDSKLTYSTDFDEENDEVSIHIHIKEGKPGKIAKVRLEGISSKEAKQVKEHFFTRPHQMLTSWYTKTGIYQHELVEQDRMSVISYFQNKGYADVHVTPQVVESKEGKIDIVFDIALGPVYKINEITFTGNEAFSNEDVEKFLAIQKDDLYSPQEIQNTVKAIKDLYGKNGYIDATVSYQQTLISEESHEYNLHFEIYELEQYCVGKVKVLGNYYTSPNVILNETLLVPGEVFDSRKLAATEERLRGTGYFKKVNIYPLPVRSTEDSKEEARKQKPLKHRDIYIEVEEGQTGHATLSGGGSTTDSFFGAVELSENNFNIGGLSTLFSKGLSSMRGGGEFFHLRFNLGNKITYYTMAWMTPYAGDSLWRFGFDINKTYNRNQAKNFDYESLGEKIYATYPLSSFWTFGVNYNLVNTKNRFKDGATWDQRIAVGPGGLASTIGVNLKHDSTNHPRRPSAGLRSTLDASFTGVGGSFTYWKFLYLNTQYLPLGKNAGFFKLRGNLKFISPFGKTPIEGQGFDRPLPLAERLFLGGETDLRGYKNDRVGPNKGWENPIGGVSYGFASLEYVYPIIDPIQLFAFFDAGSLSLKRFKIDHIRMSCGAGVRLDILGQMPITIAYARPINPENREEQAIKNNFLFSIGVQY